MDENGVGKFSELAIGDFFVLAGMSCRLNPRFNHLFVKTPEGKAFDVTAGNYYDNKSTDADSLVIDWWPVMPVGDGEEIHRLIEKSWTGENDRWWEENKHRFQRED